MKGRWLILGGGTLLALFAAALWYTQFYAWYEEIPEPEGGYFQGTYQVETWRAIDGTSSPLKLRVCATVTPETAQQITDDMFELPPGDPLVAPDWFDCFDAKQIARDLEARKASFYMLGASGFDGVDEVMALYPDGRLFIWRQLDARFQ